MRSLGRRCGFTVFVGREIVVEKARAVEGVVDDDWISIWERRERNEECVEVILEVDLEAEAARALNEGIADDMICCCEPNCPLLGCREDC